MDIPPPTPINAIEPFAQEDTPQPLDNEVYNPAMTSALKSYLAGQELSIPEGRPWFETANPAEFLAEIGTISKKVKQSKTFRYTERFRDIVQPMQSFFLAVDQGMSSNPAGVVWGCLRFVIEIVCKIPDQIDNILEVVESIVRNLRFYQDYAVELYPQSDRVQQCLVQVYGAIFLFCKTVNEVFVTKSGRQRGALKTKWKLISPWKPLKKAIKDLDDQKQLLEPELQHADRLMDNQDRKLREETARAQDERKATKDEMANEKRQEEREDKWEKTCKTFLKEVPYADCRVRHGTCRDVLAADPESCSWLLDHVYYKKWKTVDSNGLFWLHGKPGSGKTILASRIIDDLIQHKATESATVAFFYCQYDDIEKRKPIVLLGSILHQIIEQLTSDATSVLEGLRDTSSIQSSVSGLIDLISATTKNIAKTFIVIDAIDECDFKSIGGLLSQLQSLSKDVRIFVTSRDADDMERTCRDGIKLSIDNGLVQADIKRFIARKIVASEPETSTLDPPLVIMDATLRQQVINTLLNGANGMFLWVDLQIAHLRQQATDWEIQEALQVLPHGLDATFIRALRQIEELRPVSRRARAQRALRWVVCAVRPLNLYELAEAVAMDDMKDAWDASRIVKDPASLIEDCACLIARRGTGSLPPTGAPPTWIPLNRHPVAPPPGGPPGSLGLRPSTSFEAHLIHASVKEFLTQRPQDAENLPQSLHHYLVFPVQETHCALARSCFKYLQFPGWESILGHNIPTNGINKRPFCAYVSTAGLKHLQAAGTKAEPAFTDFCQAVDPGSKTNTLLTRHFNNPMALTMGGPTPLPSINLTALHIAASLDLSEFVQRLLEASPETLNQRDTCDRTPLHLAAKSSPSSMKILLHAGADVSDVDNQGRTPLHSAVSVLSSMNDGKCTSLLLEHGAAMGIADKSGETPFLAACRFGAIRSCQLLLSNGARSTDVDLANRSALHRLMDIGTMQNRSSRVKAVKELNIVFEPIINLADSRKQTALLLAATSGHPDVVEFLLQQGADHSIADNLGCTPLHKAATAMRQGAETVSILLRAGAENGPDRQGIYPIHHAARFGNLDILKVLIKEGGSTGQEKDAAGASILHIIVQRYSLPLDMLEFAVGLCDVNGMTVEGLRPLHFAISCAKIEVVELLLKHGADPHAEDKLGSTPLHRAASSLIGARARLIALLLQHGAKVDATTKTGLTPLHTLLTPPFPPVPGAPGAPRSSTTEESLLESARMLVVAGAKGNVKDYSGRTPIHAAADGNHIPILEYFIEQSFTLDSVESKDNTKPSPFSNALHKAAATTGGAETVAIILKAGFTSQPNSHGSYPIHQAARLGSLATMKLLIEEGTSTGREKESQGFNILHLVAQRLNPSVDMLEYALKFCEVNDGAGCGQTPLHLAVSSGKFEIAEMLLKYGADLHLTNKWGSSALHYAALTASPSGTKLVRMLLKHGAKADATNNDGVTALHLMGLAFRPIAPLPGAPPPNPTPNTAPHMHTVEAAKLLIASGASINSMDKNGRTPIHDAALGCYTPLIQFYVSQGITLDSVDSHGATLLHEVSTRSHGSGVECMKYLLTNGLASVVNKADNTGRTAMHHAARLGNDARMRLLREYGASMSHVDNEGRTVLHDFASTRLIYLEGAKFILAQDDAPAIDAITNQGQTALQLAAAAPPSVPQENVFKLFLEHGADASKVDANGATTLHLLARSLVVPAGPSTSQSLELFIDRGVSINSADNDGRTPLHYAMGVGQLNMIQTILALNPDVNIRDNKGNTPLHTAITASLAGKPSHIRLLVINGANMNIPNEAGETAWEYAVASRPHCAMILASLRVDTNPPVLPPVTPSPNPSS